MTKSELRAVYGTLEAIGNLFPERFGGPLTKGAVSQWSDTGPIPKLREYQLRELVPDIELRIAEAIAKAA